MVAAEYKTNHHFVRRGSSPEVKMSESKVPLQMVNVKYNYFRLHVLLSGTCRNDDMYKAGCKTIDSVTYSLVYSVFSMVFSVVCLTRLYNINNSM